MSCRRASRSTRRPSHKSSTHRALSGTIAARPYGRKTPDEQDFSHKKNETKRPHCHLSVTPLHSPVIPSEAARRCPPCHPERSASVVEGSFNRASAPLRSRRQVPTTSNLAADFLLAAPPCLQSKKSTGFEIGRCPPLQSLRGTFECLPEAIANRACCKMRFWG